MFSLFKKFCRFDNSYCEFCSIITISIIKCQIMKLFMSVSVLLFLSFIFLLSVQGFAGEDDTTQSKKSGLTNTYTCYTSMNDTGAWYYYIKLDNKKFIIQKTIPVIEGHRAFDDSIQAASVCLLVKQKLEHHLFPPSVTKNDLDSLKIHY